MAKTPGCVVTLSPEPIVAEAQEVVIHLPGYICVCFIGIALCVDSYCQKFLVSVRGGGRGWLAVRG